VINLSASFLSSPLKYATYFRHSAPAAYVCLQCLYFEFLQRVSHRHTSIVLPQRILDACSQFMFACWLRSIYRRMPAYELAVATKASSVARSLKLRHVDLGWYMDGWPPGQNRRLNLGSFVGVDWNQWPTVYIANIVLTRTSMNQTKPSLPMW